MLEKLYLCGINNNMFSLYGFSISVVICLKNCTFVVSTTTRRRDKAEIQVLWFAWKIVPLWYQQQQSINSLLLCCCCDLLEKLYLCGINNNKFLINHLFLSVVICLKNCTFVVSTTTLCFIKTKVPRCDLLEKLYLCGIHNNDSAWT